MTSRKMSSHIKEGSDEYFWVIVFGVFYQSRLSETANILQHGQTSCLLHCIAVAYCCNKLAILLPFLDLRNEEFVRGALLHDYFLYDWHCRSVSHRFHGFTHPKTALLNASQDFTLGAVEQDIIKSHMFPLTLIPPKHLESYLVCFVDKICTIYEFFCKDAYPRLSFCFSQKNNMKGCNRVTQC